MKNFLLLLFLIINIQAFAQNDLPVVKATSKTVSIKDGNIIRTDYWTLSPETKLDIYQADKTSATKTVTFYTDIDSIAFEVKPRDSYDFVILLNGTDSCFTQIKSGITYQPNENEVLKSDTIPFRLTSHNNIVIEAIVNELDTVQLMFHTAANSISLTKEAIQRVSVLKFNENSVDVNTWGGRGVTRFSPNNHLKIGAFSWNNQVVWESRHSGPETDGKFGPNLFENKIIEIDYENNRIVIHSTLPNIDERYEKLNLTFNQDMMFLKGESTIEENSFSNFFLIHSGYAGTLLYDDVSVNKYQMGKKLEIIDTKTLKDSAGKEVKTQKAILPKFEIAGIKYTEAPVGFFEGSIGRQRMSVIGGDMLKRFNVFYDLQNAYVYIRANSLMDLPYSDI